jgi:hypothetical protein
MVANCTRAGAITAYLVLALAELSRLFASTIPDLKVL